LEGEVSTQPGVKLSPTPPDGRSWSVAEESTPRVTKTRSAH